MVCIAQETGGSNRSGVKGIVKMLSGMKSKLRPVETNKRRRTMTGAEEKLLWKTKGALVTELAKACDEQFSMGVEIRLEIRKAIEGRA